MRSSPGSTTIGAWCSPMRPIVRWPVAMRRVLVPDATVCRQARGRASGALHGCPTPFKDLDAAFGLPFTKGSPIYRDVIATDDSAIVERIRRAGAVGIGKTNVPEFGMGSHTY